jgi:hypothetical protein
VSGRVFEVGFDVLGRERRQEVLRHLQEVVVAVEFDLSRA